jgi:hypothetical protein
VPAIYANRGTMPVQLVKVKLWVGRLGGDARIWWLTEEGVAVVAVNSREGE